MSFEAVNQFEVPYKNSRSSVHFFPVFMNKPENGRYWLYFALFGVFQPVKCRKWLILEGALGRSSVQIFPKFRTKIPKFRTLFPAFYEQAGKQLSNAKSRPHNANTFKDGFCQSESARLWALFVFLRIITQLHWTVNSMIFLCFLFASLTNCAAPPQECVTQQIT